MLKLIKMSINFQKYIRIKDWWSHILPPVLLFFYAGISNSSVGNNKIIQLTIALIFISILTAIIGYYINDLFDINDDLLAGKSNFIATQSAIIKLLIPILIIAMFFMFYLYINRFCNLFEQQIFFSFFSLNVLLFMVYSIPPLRLKSNPIASLIIDALYSGTIFYIMAFLLVQKKINDNYLILIFSFGFLRGIRNYLSHLVIDFDNDLKVQHQSLATKFGQLKTQIIANTIYPFELLFMALFIYFTIPKLIVPSLILLVIFFIKWLFSITKNKANYLAELNDLYEIWLPLLLLLNVVYLNHSLYILLIIHTILFPNYLDKIYFYTIFKITGPLRKERQ